MKRILYLFLGVSIFLAAVACSENERIIYEAKSALYFGDYKNEDSLHFSFTMVAGAPSSVNLSVRMQLLGQTQPQDKPYKVVVEPTSTAVAGTHYELNQENCVFSANRVSDYLVVKLLKAANLSEETVKLDLRIVPSDAFDVGYEGRALLRIRMTNMLVKPSYWDSNLALYFDIYSKVKHQKIIDIMGADFPLKWNTTMITPCQLAGRAASLFYALNPTQDENGNTIEPWPAF